MKLEDLCLKDRLILSREAERMRAGYFRELVRRMDPRDETVARLLEDAALDEEAHAELIWDYGLLTVSHGPMRMTPAVLGSLLKEHLPTLTHRKAGTIPPRRALEILHEVETESARLYGKLEKAAGGNGTRSFFRHLRERETAHAGVV